MHNTIVAHDKTIHKPLPQQFLCLPSHPYFYTITSTKKYHLRDRTKMVLNYYTIYPFVYLYILFPRVIERVLYSLPIHIRSPDYLPVYFHSRY